MAGAVFQGTGQGVHLTQLLAQPGFLIIPIPFKSSHLHLHAVFYGFEALKWVATHVNNPTVSLAEVGSEWHCDSVWSSCLQWNIASLHQLRVLGETVGLTSVLGMGTWRAVLAGLVVSGNMKHLLIATGVVRAQCF